jgi:cardiolipin synthase
MNPYFTDRGMLERIVDAGKRGVRVRILVPVESNNPPADAALRHQYGRLLDAGVEIWEYPAVMHAKVTVADDTVIVGTVNYDAWALYRNLEVALLIEDVAVADDVRASFKLTYFL